MSQKVVSVPGISCGHCVASIKNVLSEVPGVTKVDGNAAEKTITVCWDSPASWEQISLALEDAGYPPA